MNKYTFFLFFLAGPLLIYSQDILLKKTKAVPFSIYEAENYDTDLSTLLDTHPTFVPFNTCQKEFDHSKTYWLKLDFTQELDTLQTYENWKLRTAFFDYAMMYYRNQNGIDSIPTGVYNIIESRTSVNSIQGISFNKKKLINGFLFLKFKITDRSYSLKKIKVEYTSEATNTLFTNYYSIPQVQSLFFYYSFTGVCLIIFICFSSIYTYTRKKEFLYYALYVLFSFFYLVSWKVPFQGFINFTDYPITVYFYQISQVFINLFYCLFIIHYLNTNEKYPKLHIIVKTVTITLIAIIGLDIILRILGLFKIHTYLLNFQRLLMTAFGIFGMVYLLLKSKDRLPYFIVVGSFLYMLGAWLFFFSQESTFMITGITLEIITFTLGIAYKIHLQHKQKLHLLEEISQKEISTLRAQMNPHFIFNSLNSIQHLILKDDKMGALKYLNKFGKLTRSVLDNSAETKVSLTDEINVLNSYLELESLRFDQAFSYTIEIDEKLEPDDFEIPLLLVQPFVENSIIHGLLPKQLGNKQLTIRFKLENENLICEVEDNGVGRLTSQTLKKTRVKGKKSRGIEITERRLELISNSEHKDTNVNIHDKYDSNGNPSGTKVIIKILVA